MENQDLSAFKIIKQGELSALRSRLHEEQGGVCPILKQKFAVEEMVVDHEHRKNKSKPIGSGDGSGLIRGAIQRHANALEGKITNNWRRNGMDKFDITLPDFLRNLADYLERDNTDIVHPSELPSPKIVKKSCFNKLVKAMQKEGKVAPTYRLSPKGKKIQKLTKTLAKQFETYNIDVEFY